jgi:DNA-binding transcriptional regulator LsrR (DeoR family)
VNAWTTVLADVSVRGGTPAQVATRLGLPTSLVQAILDHAERLGLVAVAGRGCGTACPAGAEMPTGCVGCPVSLP